MTRVCKKGLLAGKQAVIINTQGKSKSEYRNSGMDKALSMTSDLGIYEYCGLELKQHYFFDQADRAKEEDILNWEEQIENAYESGDLSQSSSHQILQDNINQ
jgi:NAD(P)H dehydrogenase (quinone)